MIRVWHVCISGFLQNIGQRHGVFRLWSRLRLEHAGPTTEVALLPWNADWSRYAKLIYHTSINDGAKPTIRVYAYSWGAGHGAIRLARALQSQDLPVASFCLSDPVFRSAWLFRRWRAFWPLQQIVVPANVEFVRWFRQEHDWPRGHDLISEADAATRIAPPEIAPAGVGHTFMDDLRAWHEAALDVSRG